MNILVTGGTGLVGRHLIKHLEQQGHHTAVLSRTKGKSSQRTFIWDIKNRTLEEEAVTWADAIIHLAGAGIADRLWTKKRKMEIRASRVDSADLLFQTCIRLNHWPSCFISASGVGFYGDTGNTVVDETAMAGEGFLAHTCTQWEASAIPFAKQGCRVVMLRTGIVLASKGGALPLMALPIKLFAGTAMGTGEQFISWIHIEDLCRLYASALSNSLMTGAYNAVATEVLTNMQFTITMAKVLDRPLWLPAIPAALLKLVLGEMASTVLMSSRVSNQKLMQTGFQFEYNTLQPAMKNLLTR